MSATAPHLSARTGRARRLMPAPLRGAIKLALMLLCGTAMGLAGTAFVMTRRFDPAAVRIGAWTTWARAGTPDIDPYAQAITARSGTVLMAAAEGLSFTASTDDTGAALSALCHYRLDGPVPPARFWTVTATTGDGLVMDNPLGRGGFSSGEILRRQDGSFSIVAGPTARPGNWLPLTGRGPVVLTLRLYETPLSSVAGDVRRATLPSLTRLGCSAR